MAEVGDAWFGDPSVLAVHEWLQSSDGQSMIRRTLQTRGLPAAFDSDLEQMVTGSAAGAVSRGATIESPPAWATSCLRLRSLDLLKSPKSKLAPRRDRDDERMGDEEARFGPDATDESVERFEVSNAADDVRRRVLGIGSVDWRVAAALAVLANDVDQAEPSARCPHPSGGAGELETSNWVGLWYAGRLDCFDGDSEAVRKRRSRASAEVRRLLADVGRAAGLERVNHG